MPGPAKIATCCYCGTRAALVLRGRERHELSCASCGAPLHALKMLRKEHVKPSGQKERGFMPNHMRKKRKKIGSRRRKIAKVMDEVWDVIEDIFD